MSFHRSVDPITHDIIRYVLLGPQGAMALIVMDVFNHISGDLSYHIPCFDKDCKYILHGACDIFGEAFCHSDCRSMSLTTLDDDIIFEYLEEMYEVDIQRKRGMISA